MRAALTRPNERAWVVRSLTLDTEKPTVAPNPEMEAYKVDFNANGHNVGVTLVNDYEEYRKYAQEQRVFVNRDITSVYVWAYDFSDAIKVAAAVIYPDDEEAQNEAQNAEASEGTTEQEV